ncbi:MAG TPA: flagellar basal body P-ring formation chaperone FlgA [Verrucomicrobiae bacterium]|jgi:flagella basal body P-ring formation protein FlgA|nr:flagellar basal body P-ring formation chaperone FlgA [Verrucomicrobiae bacterium]
MKRIIVAFLCIGAAYCLQASDPAALQLASAAQVTGSGVFLQQLVTSGEPLPNVRLCDAPAVGATVELSRAQINDLLAAAAPAWVTTNWAGADTVRVLRRSRTLNEADMLALLTARLQQDFVKDQGDLELNLSEPWNPPVLPDEPLTVKILEAPASGVAPLFIVRFQLCTATGTVGTWGVSLRAHIWRDVWVAHSDLVRGESAADADIVRDRRDVLSTHAPLADFSPGDTTLELAGSVSANNILLARDFKLRAVIRRGQVADAVVADGALNITMKVEALEDGAPGQMIHFRNPTSQRSLTGKVLDEHTIQVSL